MLHVGQRQRRFVVVGGTKDYNTIYNIYTDTDYIYKLLPREQTNLNYFLWGKSLLTSLVVVVVAFYYIIIIVVACVQIK